MNPDDPNGASKNTKPHVLIIEDDPSLSKMYSLKFSSEGFDVSVAGDGATGLAKLAELKPQVVLLDMMLPKYSGLEVLEQIKQYGNISVPVIALTNLTEKKEAERAKELGAKEYLAKAMHTPDDVIQIVKKYI